MTIRDDRWFEVWYIDGVDLLPSCLYVVAPNQDHSGRISVYDPFNNDRVVFEGKDYETVMHWLTEDEFMPIDGRQFRDD